MKILKLQSDNTISLSQFTNNLQIPLQLNKNAKVALKTLSFEFQPTTIEINGINDYLTFTINTVQHLITPKSGKFNIRELCEMLTIYINEIVPSDDAASEGVEFLCDYTGNAKDGYIFNISFVKSEPIDVNDANTALVNMAYDNGFYKVNEIENQYVSTAQTLQNVCLGGFQYSFTISQQEGQGTEPVSASSWYIGMADAALGRISDTDIQIKENFSNYIGCVGGFYEYKVGDNSVVTQYVPTLDDIVLVSKKFIDERTTQINYDISRGGNIIATFEGDLLNNTNIIDEKVLNQDLFIKIGNDNGFIKFSDVATFPTALSQYDGSDYVKLGHESIKNVKKSLKAATPITVSLNFSKSLLDKLGFKSQPKSETAVSYKWTADNNTKNAIFDNDLVMTINQLNTDGYNHEKKQKESILMVITAGAVLANTLTSGEASFNLSYTDNFPTYLNLGNTNPTSYNNLTISARSDNQLINVNGKMSCTLLFKDESDFELKL
jgi:hypothetical protein